MNDDWQDDCLRWRGRLLTGTYAHYCYDWDMLPVDESTPEYQGCTCFSRHEEASQLRHHSAWRNDR